MKLIRGFTLVELLVVIAVIALLMSIMLPVLQGARAQAYRAICSNSERNLLLGLTIYATFNNSNFPSHPGNRPPALGYHFGPDTVGHYFALIILKNMGRDVTGYEDRVLPVQMYRNFFCPANPIQKKYPEMFCNTPAKPDIRNWYYHPGYFFVVPDDEPTSKTFPITGKDGSPDPAKSWVRRIDVSHSSEAELVIDFTVERPSKSGKFINPQDSSTAYTTSHYTTRDKPAGGNMGFVDGHVEWRRFAEMCRRWGGNRSQSWWW